MIKQRNDNLTKEDDIRLGFQIQAMKKLKLKEKDGYILTDEDKVVVKEGEEALEILVGNLYNLARKQAHYYHKLTHTKYPIDDLIQDAILALVEAAYKYDPTQNCRMSTYARYGINKKVSTIINYIRPIRLPENRMGEYATINKTKKEYNSLPEKEQAKYSNEMDYVYKNSGVKKEDIDIILANMQPHISLEAKIYEGDGEMIDLIPDDKQEQEVIQYGNLDDRILKVIESLDSYEKDLIAFEFGAFPASMSYDEFETKYELTESKVKSETRKVIRKMRKMAVS